LPHPKPNQLCCDLKCVTVVLHTR